MNSEIHNEIIEKYNITNYKDLLSVCLGQAKVRQKRLGEYLGDLVKANYEVDVVNGKLYLGEKEFDIEFIGTVSLNDHTWLWADANSSFPKQFVQTIKQLYSIGKKYNINEFINSKLQTTNDINGHNLSAIASVLLGNNLCYYNGKSGNIVVSMFIKNLDVSIFKPIDVNKFNSIVLECTGGYNINDKLFIQSFLDMNNCKMVMEENKITGIWDNGSNYIATFDENGNLMNANIKMLS